MNINKLIDKLKKSIGLNGTLKNVYSDTVLRDSIINSSLVTFNRFSGFNMIVNLTDIMSVFPYEPLEGSSGRDIKIRVPEYLMDHFDRLGVEITTVNEMRADRNPIYNGLFYSGGWKTDIISLQAQQFKRNNYDPPTFKFRAPDTIIVKNYQRDFTTYDDSIFKLAIRCKHPKNLSTITTGLEEWFEELCKYDIMINIYNNDLKNLKIDIGSASVDLALDEFASATADRRDLLQTIRKKSAYDNIEVSGF